MRKSIAFVAVLAALAVPAGASAFHHRDLPSTACANENAGSPANDNGMAKEALAAHNPTGLPLPPLGSPGSSGMTSAPGNGQGDGADHCAAATG